MASTPPSNKNTMSTLSAAARATGDASSEPCARLIESARKGAAEYKAYTDFRDTSIALMARDKARAEKAVAEMKARFNPNSYASYKIEDLEKFDKALLNKIVEETVMTQEILGHWGPMFVARMKGKQEHENDKIWAPGSKYKLAQLIALKYERDDWQQCVVRKVRFEVMDMIECTMYRKPTGSPCYEAIDKKSRFVVEASDMKELGLIVESEYGESWTEYFDLDLRARGHGMSAEKKKMKEFLEAGRVEVYKGRTGRKILQNIKSPPVKRKGTLAKKDRQSLLVAASRTGMLGGMEMGSERWSKGVEDVMANAYIHKIPSKRVSDDDMYAVTINGAEMTRTDQYQCAELVFAHYGEAWREHIPMGATTERERKQMILSSDKNDEEKEQQEFKRLEEVKDIVINAYIHRAHQVSYHHHPYAVRIGDTEYCSHNLWGCAEVIHEHYGQHWREHVPLATEAGRESNKKYYRWFGPFMNRRLATSISKQET